MHVLARITAGREGRGLIRRRGRFSADKDLAAMPGFEAAVRALRSSGALACAKAARLAGRMSERPSGTRLRTRKPWCAHSRSQDTSGSRRRFRRRRPRQRQHSPACRSSERQTSLTPCLRMPQGSERGADVPNAPSVSEPGIILDPNSSPFVLLPHIFDPPMPCIGSGPAAPIPITGNATGIEPACSKSSVTLTTSPLVSGWARWVNIRW